jgi:hypothetical protein
MGWFERLSIEKTTFLASSSKVRLRVELGKKRNTEAASRSSQPQQGGPNGGLSGLELSSLDIS